MVLSAVSQSHRLAFRQFAVLLDFSTNDPLDHVLPLANCCFETAAIFLSSTQGEQQV